MAAGIACSAAVWFVNFIKRVGGAWVSRMTSIGLSLGLIQVVAKDIGGWDWSDTATNVANGNKTGETSNKAVVSSVLLCLWAFVGVESAAVSTGMVDNPQRTVPMATMLGTGLAGIIYILATQVMSGMFPAAEMAASGAPFAVSTSKMVGSWAAPLVSAFTAIACLTSLGSWMMLVGQAGARAAQDGNFPAVYGEMDKNGVPKKGLILASCKMTVLMILLTVASSSGANASDLFGQLTGIAVLLTMLPYFYSAVNLIRFEGATTRSVLSIVASVIAAAFCFVALAGATSAQLTATFIVSLIILMFYANKIGRKSAATAA